MFFSNIGNSCSMRRTARLPSWFDSLVIRKIMGDYNLTRDCTVLSLFPARGHSRHRVESSYLMRVRFFVMPIFFQMSGVIMIYAGIFHLHLWG